MKRPPTSECSPVIAMTHDVISPWYLDRRLDLNHPYLRDVRAVVVYLNKHKCHREFYLLTSLENETSKDKAINSEDIDVVSRHEQKTSANERLNHVLRGTRSFVHVKSPSQSVIHHNPRTCAWWAMRNFRSRSQENACIRMDNTKISQSIYRFVPDHSVRSVFVRHASST